MKQQETLVRLLPNAPEDFSQPSDVKSLSYHEAAGLLAQLREAGVEPVPSSAQLDLIDNLLNDLSLTGDELYEIIPAGDLGKIRTSAAASRVIEDLNRLHDERKPPSARQRLYIDGLLEKTAITGEDAATLIGLSSIGHLTGGRHGTASKLIEALNKRKEECKTGTNTPSR